MRRLNPNDITLAPDGSVEVHDEDWGRVTSGAMNRPLSSNGICENTSNCNGSTNTRMCSNYTRCDKSKNTTCPITMPN